MSVLLARRATRSIIAACVAAISLAAPARARQPIPDLESQLAETQKKLRDPATDAAAKIALLDARDDLERKLIAAAPDDDRAPTWLADRAAAAADLAARDGAALHVLYGIPTQPERDRVHNAASTSLELATQAETAAHKAEARLEAKLVDRAHPDLARAQAPEIEAKLNILLDVEQARRIPYLKAAAAILECAAGLDPAKCNAALAAAKQLDAIPPTQDPSANAPESDDLRALAIGDALLRAASTGRARAEDALAEAAKHFAPLSHRYQPFAPGAGTLLRARLGMIRAAQDPGARPRSADPAAERELDELEAEDRAAAMLDRAAREPSSRDALVAQAVAALLGSIDGAAPEAPGRRAAIYERVSIAIPPSVSFARLPPEALFAKAVVRIRTAGMADAVARLEAIGLLSQVVDRADAPESLRAQARWERAVIAQAGPDRLADLDAVAAVCRADSSTPHAMIASRRVAELFAGQLAAAKEPTADPLGALPQPWLARLPAMNEALRFLLRAPEPQLPQWRELTIRLAFHDLTATSDAAAIDRALDASELVTPGPSPLAALPGGEALAEAIDKEVQRRHAAALEHAGKAAAITAAKREWESILPLEQRAAAWSVGRDKPRSTTYSFLLGESLAGAQDARSAATLSSVVGSDIDQPDSPLWVRFRLALAHARRLSADDAGALAILRALADHFEGAPGISARDPAYWAAWSEILSILQSQNTDGARSADIRAQIKRLELLDPNLGGPPYAQPIAELRTAVGP